MNNNEIIFKQANKLKEQYAEDQAKRLEDITKAYAKQEKEYKAKMDRKAIKAYELLEKLNEFVLNLFLKLM